MIVMILQKYKKTTNFTPLLMDSLISTTDNDHWREQRNHYTEAFLPNAF